MDDLTMILGWVGTVALALSLAACAGLRAWLPLLVAGAAARLGLVQLGESFQLLASTPALAVFSIATVIEVVGDKFPAVDHALDAVGTFARPAAGTVAAAAVMWQAESPVLALVLGLVIGAPTAAAPHAVKSASRGLSSTFTLGLANPALSFAEDAIALGLAAFALVAPVAVALAVLVVGVVVLRWVLRRRAARGAPAPASTG